MPSYRMRSDRERVRRTARPGTPPSARRKRVQHVDGPSDVQALAQPAWHRRSRVDVKPFELVSRSESLDRAAGDRNGRRGHWQPSAVGAPEGECSVGLTIDLVAVFMDRAVMTATERREVRQCCGPAVRPVLDVMSLNERETAAREATALVAMLERAP